MTQDGMTAVVDALYQPAVLLAGAGRVVVHANAAAVERFGLHPGATCHGVLRRRDEPCPDCPLEAVRARRAAPRCEFDRLGARLGMHLAPLDDDLFLATLADAVPLRHVPGDGQDLLPTILDSASDVVIACDRDHVIQFVNRALVERSGVPAAALIGRDFRTIYPPLEGLDWGEVAERVLERGEVIRLHDVEYKHSVGGGQVWANVTFAPWRDASGAIVGSVTTIDYLTEQRRLALQLAESERRYQALYEAAPVGLAIIGPDRRVRLGNSTAKHAFKTPMDFTGSLIDEFIAPEDRTRVLIDFKRAVETSPHPEGNDFTAVGPEGERRRFHVRVSDIDFQGERCALVAMVDVTELRRLQEQLSRAERLAGLGSLAAGVAHEFNNVLAAIQGRAEIIAQSARDAAPVVDDCARAIVRHSRRGAEIIAQINSLVGTRPVRPVAVRWEDVLEDVLASLAPRLAEDKITVARDYQATRPVSADAGQVHQLILNLLQNARDAIRPQGRGTIRVGTRDVSDGVALDITDSGVGMDEVTRHRLFEPFFTTKGSADRRAERSADLGLGLGLGLGLAIVYGVVRAHDGRIEVASTPGHGSRITVIFPASVAPADFGRSVPVRLAAAPRTLRVIVVDDDADVTEMISLALTTRGCKAIEINDGRRAVDGCVEIAADVIIIDRVMPPVDGLDVLREVRRRGVQTPALLLSGRRADEDPELLRELGVRRRLEKPIGLADLFAAVDEASGAADGVVGGGPGAGGERPGGGA
jgi:two-component system, cell cycle sensor histidine kinase and response regulator CckA